MRFYKEDKKWYIDYPEWTGEKWELEMVFGADTFLDIVAGPNDECYIQISSEPFVADTEPIKTNAYPLVKIEDTPSIGGAKYLLKDWYGTEYNHEIWLCHVVEHIFGEMPEIIYIA